MFPRTLMIAQKNKNHANAGDQSSLGVLSRFWAKVMA